MAVTVYNPVSLAHISCDTLPPGVQVYFHVALKLADNFTESPLQMVTGVVFGDIETIGLLLTTIFTESDFVEFALPLLVDKIAQ